MAEAEALCQQPVQRWTNTPWRVEGRVRFYLLLARPSRYVSDWTMERRLLASAGVRVALRLPHA